MWTRAAVFNQFTPLEVRDIIKCVINCPIRTIRLMDIIVPNTFFRWCPMYSRMDPGGTHMFGWDTTLDRILKHACT